MRPDCEHWAQLADRKAVGEELCAQDVAFMREHEATCAECAAEAAVWGGLGSIGDGESNVDEVLVDRVLKQVRETPVASNVRSISTARSRRTLALSVGFGVLAAAAAAVLLVRSSTTKEARLEERVAARLTLASAGVGVDGKDVLAGQELADGANLRTGKGTACFRMAPGASACLQRGGELRIDEAFQSHGRVTLVRGKLAVSFDSKAPGGAFVIAFPQGNVTAVGTRFSVEIEQAGQAPTVRVLEGKVTMTLGARQQLVAADEVIEPTGARRAIRDLERGSERGLVGLADACRGEQAATIEVSAPSTTSAVSVDRWELGPAPLTVQVAPGEHLVSADGSQSETVVAQPGTRVSVALRAATAPSSEPGSPPAASGGPGEVPQSASELLQQARALRASGRLGEAAEAYRKLLRAWPRSAEARAATVSLGDVQLSQGDASGALRMFDGYLASGGGALAPEARYGRIRALRSLGRGSEERQAIEQFLADYPSSVQARALKPRLAELDGAGH